MTKKTEITNPSDAVPATEPLNQSGNGVNIYDDESQESVVDETDDISAVTFSAEEYCGFFGNYLQFNSVVRVC